MSLVERSGEELARFIDRRKFLRKAAITIFSFATASAINLDQVLNAEASCSYSCPGAACCPHGGTISDKVCQCSPSNGNICPSSDCNLYDCKTSVGCNPDLSTYPGSSGCWCTKCCTSGCHTIYYVCCDCKCPNNYLCTCVYTFTFINPSC